MEATPVSVLCRALQKKRKKERGREKKISLIAITPPSIQSNTCYHSALLLEATSERLLLPLTSLPLGHMSTRPNSATETSVCLGKIPNKE